MKSDLINQIITYRIRGFFSDVNFVAAVWECMVGVSVCTRIDNKLLQGIRSSTHRWQTTLAAAKENVS